MFNPKLNRAVAAVTALGGILVLTYFAVFFLEYVRAGGGYLGAMGAGFWLLLGLGAVMVLQPLLPRPDVPTETRLGSLMANQESAIILALVLLVVAVGLGNPRFLAERNLLDILQGNAYIAVAAIGMSMVIITGNIDISVGSLIGLLAVVSGRLVVGDAPVWVAWLAPLLVGAGVGALIGLLVAYLKIPSIVVTLGMLSILKGISDSLDGRRAHHWDAGGVLLGASAAPGGAHAGHLYGAADACSQRCGCVTAGWAAPFTRSAGTRRRRGCRAFRRRGWSCRCLS